MAGKDDLKDGELGRDSVHAVFTTDYFLAKAFETWCAELGQRSRKHAAACDPQHVILHVVSFNRYLGQIAIYFT